MLLSHKIINDDRHKFICVKIKIEFVPGNEVTVITHSWTLKCCCYVIFSIKCNSIRKMRLIIVQTYLADTSSTDGREILLPFRLPYKT